MSELNEHVKILPYPKTEKKTGTEIIKQYYTKHIQRQTTKGANLNF